MNKSITKLLLCTLLLVFIISLGCNPDGKGLRRNNPPARNGGSHNPLAGNDAIQKRTNVSFFITSEGSVASTFIEKRNVGPPHWDPDGEDQFIDVFEHTGIREDFSGGNLGGIKGADAQCKRLAEAAGLMGREWKAFLYTSTEDAYERIGTGPWYNIDGKKIADNVEGLKNQNNTEAFLKLLKDEKGNNLSVAQHDIFIGNTTKNCNNWTSENDAHGGSSHRTGFERMPVGHASQQDINDANNHWLTGDGHTGMGACSPGGIVGEMGAGKFYCFACDKGPQE